MIGAGSDQPDPTPLSIGVTGHRYLRAEDLPHLEKSVGEILARLRRESPSAPFLVISPLAEGADRLVARLALEWNANLEVPLPMPAPLYEEDFREPGSVDEFRALLGRAGRVFEVPPLCEPGAAIPPGPARDRRYELGGEYVVSHSLILIALWDGVASGKTGGTAAMVKLRTEGQLPLFHILTPRRSNPNPPGEAFRIREINPRP